MQQTASTINSPPTEIVPEDTSLWLIFDDDYQHSDKEVEDIMVSTNTSVQSEDHTFEKECKRMTPNTKHKLRMRKKIDSEKIVIRAEREKRKNDKDRKIAKARSEGSTHQTIMDKIRRKLPSLKSKRKTGNEVLEETLEDDC